MFFFLMIRRPPRSTLLTHSFPTRRSSDLIARDLADLSTKARERKLKVEEMQGGCFTISSLGGIRSEEHTSELQSLMRISYAVFCLKKKKYMTQKNSHKRTLRKFQ